MLDVPQFYAVFWGAIKIGAVPIPVNTMLTPDDYEYYLNDSRARVLVVSEQLVPLVSRDQGRPPLSPGHDRHLGDEGRPYSFPPDVPPRAGDDQDRVYDERRRRLLALQLRLDRLAARARSIPSTTWSRRQKRFGKGVLGLTEDDIVFSRPRASSSRTASAMPAIYPSRSGASVVLNADAAQPGKRLRAPRKVHARPSSSASRRFTDRCSNTRKNRTAKRAPARPQRAARILVRPPLRLRGRSAAARICITAGRSGSASKSLTA